MSEESQPSEPLASQLGTDAETLSQSKFDMEILSVTTPKQMRALLYFAILGEKDDTAKALVNHFLRLRVSEGGRGRRDIIRMESVRHGGGISLGEEIEKPNWAARNIWDRNWEEKEKERLGITEAAPK